MNLDTAIFPGDNKTITESISGCLKGLFIMSGVPSVEELVRQGNKIIIEISPEETFISIQTTLKEIK